MLSVLRPRLLALLVSSSLLLSLAACDDPTGVGSEVGDFDGGEPSSISVPPTPFTSVGEPVITGNNVRILTGQANDPIFGTLTATGYVDVGSPTSPTDSFLDTDNALTAAELRFDLNYAYGDTLQAVNFVVRDMNGEWESIGATSERRITADSIGAEVTRFTVIPVDTNTVVVPLPDAWLSANATALRDTANFAEVFNGFQITSDGGNAVVGLQASSSELRVFAGQDSASYRAARTITSLERSETVDIENRLIVQNGFGRSLQLSFDFDDDPFTTLDNAPINRASIIFPFDPGIYEDDTPPNFARPVPPTAELVGFANDSDTSAIPLVGLSLNESALEDGALVYQGNDVLSIFQEAVLGNILFERFRLRLRSSTAGGQDPITINPILLKGAEDPDEPSRARLVVTPL